MSGDVVSYSSSGTGSPASIVELDGKPPTDPYGPLELKPGQHMVVLKCDNSTKTYAIAVVAGELYRFVARTAPDVKGCVPALSRVRTTNP